MTQRTRKLVANALLGVGILTVVVFIAGHYMSAARPAWRKDMVFLGLASMSISRLVRGGRQTAMQGLD
jgi:hypothetical protein